MNLRGAEMNNSEGYDSLSSFRRYDGTKADFHSLSHLQELGLCDLDSLPFTIRLLLEAALRKCDGFLITREDVERIASWSPTMTPEEIPFSPSRVILQDFTGVPAVVDIAALRDAMLELGGDPEKVNPQVPVDLVIDHSVQVDSFGKMNSLDLNNQIEFQRIRELKNNMSPKMLCESLEAQTLLPFIEEVFSYEFEQAPDYDKLK